MTTSDRDAAWREYAKVLGRLNVQGESLETAEIDFKAGFDAAARSSAGATTVGRTGRAAQSNRPTRRATQSREPERRH